VSSIVGIDYDSDAIDVVLIDEDEGSWLGWKRYDLACGPGDSLERARRVRSLLPARQAWADAGVVAIGLESTFSNHYNAAVSLARVQGAILASLPRELPLQTFPANHRAGGWKIATVGKPAASKIDVARWAIDEGAPGGLVQDAYDAFCIARAMREHLKTEARASTRGEP
jgi:hypothetical protein